MKDSTGFISFVCFLARAMSDFIHKCLSVAKILHLCRFALSTFVEFIEVTR